MASSSIEKKMKLKRDLATALFRRHIPVLDVLNGHAQLVHWLKGQDAPSFERRFDLYDHIKASWLNDAEPINYLEFGVHEGDSFKRWLTLDKSPQSRFWGFDTFTGLPTDWTKDRPKGYFNVDGQTPVVNDSRASFVAGLFQETLPHFLKTFPNDKRLVIHNDSDLYSSTHYVLSKLDDFITPGAIIIFDEFASPLHEFRAWNDYTGAFMRRARLVGTSGPYAEQAAFIFE